MIVITICDCRINMSDDTFGKQVEEELNKAIKLAKNNQNYDKVKEFLNNSLKIMKGLVIQGYKGDYPTFIEPVYLKGNVSIGDTVLLGPKVFIGENCDLGAFTEISNSALAENVKTGKQAKLVNCVIDENVIIPEKFEGNNSFITIAKDGNLVVNKF